MNVDLNQELLDALRELKDAVEPVVSDDEGLFDDQSAIVEGPELERLANAWGRAVTLVGRIERPAQYRPIPFETVPDDR